MDDLRKQRAAKRANRSQASRAVSWKGRAKSKQDPTQENQATTQNDSNSSETPKESQNTKGVSNYARLRQARLQSLLKLQENSQEKSPQDSVS